MRTKMKIEPRVAPKVRRKVTLIYAGAGLALASIVAIFLFFYLNIGKQEDTYAKNKTYNSIAAGTWNSISTWGGGSFPPIDGMNKDIVNISHDVNYSGDITINNQVSITINGGASLVLTGDFIVNNNLTLIVNGNLTINGSLVANNGAEISVNGGGTANITQNVDFHNNTMLTIDGNLEIGGILTFANNTDFGGNGFVSLGSSNCSEWNGPPGNCTEEVTLPVELLSFSAKNEDGDVVINWQTASELNNDYFEIERSSNGIGFDVIAEINGNGTTNEMVDYEYVDTAPLNGLSYYRLIQIDFDGKSDTFNVVSVQVESLMENNVAIYPNPLIGNTLKMTIDQPEEGNIEVFDKSGNRIFAKELSGYDREEEMHLPDNMKMGIYFVNVKTASVQKSFKLVKR